MAAKRRKTIVFTHPGSVADEARWIERLLTSGAADIVHLRKPDWTIHEMRTLIDAIPASLHPQLRLHDFFALTEEFTSLGGVHLNSRNPIAPPGVASVSKSAHSIAELADASWFDYVTLSPVFDSISKQGYKSAFQPEELNRSDLPDNVVALGGVTPAHFATLAAQGFAGAALLGYVWDCDEDSRTERVETLRRRTLMMKHFALQFITHSPDADGTARQVEEALDGGCRWIQIRMKDAPDDAVRSVVERVKERCRAENAVLLLDDRVALAAECDVDGVHLGKNDMPPAEAREILGRKAIIGSTANSMADIEHIAEAGQSDYIGLGPYRFTTTKQRLAPVLGLEGYEKIFAEMRSRHIHIPVVAIGGICADDVAPLISADASGVAVSGAICGADNPVDAARRMNETVYNSEK